MSPTQLLCRHAPTDEVCFGEGGARDAGQLQAYAATIADALAGLRPGSRVVLACRDRYRFSAALIATLHRGLVVCFPESSEPTAIVAAVRKGQATALLHDQPQVTEGIEVSALEQAEHRRTVPLECALQLDQVAFVALTSGSTGAPQAHEKTLGQLVIEAACHGEGFELAGARVVSAVPAHHIYGLLFGVLLPLLSGGSTMRETELFPERLLESVAHHGARALVTVPTHLGALARQGDLKLPTVDRVFSSAGPLPVEVARALGARGLAVTEVFGSTELGGVACRRSPDEPWQPFDGVQVDCAEDDTLRVRSRWATVEPGAWSTTSDRVSLVPGGFRHLGRADSVVKIGGRRVDLRDLELQLQRVAGVREARVLAVEHSGAARDLALWAVVAASDVTVDALRAGLAERFNQVTWPRRYRLVDALPRSETGKTTRAALLSLFEEPLNTEGRAAPACTEPATPAAPTEPSNSSKVVRT